MTAIVINVPWITVTIEKIPQKKQPHVVSTIIIISMPSGLPNPNTYGSWTMIRRGLRRLVRPGPRSFVKSLIRPLITNKKREHGFAELLEMQSDLMQGTCSELADLCNDSSVLVLDWQPAMRKRIDTGEMVERRGVLHGAWRHGSLYDFVDRIASAEVEYAAVQANVQAFSYTLLGGQWVTELVDNDATDGAWHDELLPGIVRKLEGYDSPEYLPSIDQGIVCFCAVDREWPEDEDEDASKILRVVRDALLVEDV
jgi:hypothetical protein